MVSSPSYGNCSELGTTCSSYLYTLKYSPHHFQWLLSQTCEINIRFNLLQFTWYINVHSQIQP